MADKTSNEHNTSPRTEPNEADAPPSTAASGEQRPEAGEDDNVSPALSRQLNLSPIIERLSDVPDDQPIAFEMAFGHNDIVVQAENPSAEAVLDYDEALGVATITGTPAAVGELLQALNMEPSADMTSGTMMQINVRYAEEDEESADKPPLVSDIRIPLSYDPASQRIMPGTPGSSGSPVDTMAPLLEPAPMEGLSPLMEKIMAMGRSVGMPFTIASSSNNSSRDITARNGDDDTTTGSITNTAINTTSPTASEASSSGIPLSLQQPGPLEALSTPESTPDSTSESTPEPTPEPTPVNIRLTSATNDNLQGAGGNQTFTGTAAEWDAGDVIIGGAGEDTLDITSGTVTASLDGVDFNNIREVETLTLPDGGHDITVTDDYFDRGGGLNGDTFTVDASASADGLTIDGSALTGSNTLDITGGSGDDVMIGGDGNDTLNAGSGADSVNGGNGDDVVILDNAEFAASPSGIAGNHLQLWLDANDLDGDGTAEGLSESGLTAGAVSTWADKSGNGHDLIQGTAAERPTYAMNQINGRAALDFDGSDDFLEDADAENYLNGENELSAFFVVEAAQLQDDGFLSTRNMPRQDAGLTLRYDANGFAGGGTNVIKASGGKNGIGAQYESGSNAQTTNPQLIQLDRITGETLSLFLDGQADTPTNTGTPSSTIAAQDYLQIGRDALGGFWDGHIAEAMIFNKALTGPERQEVNTYITQKYGIDTFDAQDTDTISGGDGLDTLRVEGSEALMLETSPYAGISGFETIDLTGSDHAHELTFDDTYFNTLDGTSTLAIDATDNTTGLTIDGSALTGTNALDITGGAGGDVITGGAGGDVITGGGGQDLLTGGAGDDIFIFDAVSDSDTGAPDTITDFDVTSDSDQFDFSALGLTSTNFIDNNSFNGAVELRWEMSGGDTRLEFDTNGDTNADMEILLDNFDGSALTVDEFLF